MATITGTEKKNFIHAEGDGLVAPKGFKDVIGVTDAGDRLFGLDGNDIIYAGDGANALIGGLGTDEIHGGSGTDSFIISLNVESSGLSEVFDGGAGTDSLMLRTEGGIFDLSKATLSSVENIYLSQDPNEALHLQMRADQLSDVRYIFSNAIFNSLDLVGDVDFDIVDLTIGTYLEINTTAGADRLSFSDAVIKGLAINLGSGDDSLSLDTHLSEASSKTFLNGGDGNDQISSQYSLNAISGDAGDDVLSGGTKVDTLDGGIGDDRLTGGGAGDTLTGGDGADTFAYANIKFSAPRTSKHDVISDFDHLEGDLIDLSQIDADTTVSGNDAFHLGASVFSQTAGELIQISNATGTLLRGDVDGDGVADFEIQFVGHPVLVASDFIF